MKAEIIRTAKAADGEPWFIWTMPGTGKYKARPASNTAPVLTLAMCAASLTLAPITA